MGGWSSLSSVDVIQLLQEGDFSGRGSEVAASEASRVRGENVLLQR